jgi:hypothetical protein
MPNEYELIEIDSTEKEALRQAERNGYVQYGVRRDLREGHATIIKLRRARESK